MKDKSTASAPSAEVTVSYNGPGALTRPILKKALTWVETHLNSDGMLDRALVTAPNLAPFIRHVSFMELMCSGDEVVDFLAKVLAGQIADSIIEISGKTGRANLPPPLFERWIAVSQHLVDRRRVFSVQSRVFEQAHRNAESLVVPVSEGKQLTHALVFTEFWLNSPLAHR